MIKTISILALVIGFALFFVFHTDDSIILGKIGINQENQLLLLNQFTDNWNKVLAEYVDSEGKVNYAELHQKRHKIDALMLDLGSLKINALGSQQKLATYINLYNFLTIAGIIHFYPLNSIREKTSVNGFNFWKDLYFQFYDVRLTLDQIEHEILRKMNEPRIHFAIVCASVSCPVLLNRAYRPEIIDEQLNSQTKLFFADPLNISWDYANKSVRLSSICSWFKSDFGNTDERLLEFIWPFLSSEVQAKISDIKTFKVGRELTYDWSLNQQDL